MECFNVGPPLTALVQYKNNIETMSRVFLDAKTLEQYRTI